MAYAHLPAGTENGAHSRNLTDRLLAPGSMQPPPGNGRLLPVANQFPQSTRRRRSPTSSIGNSNS